ncbi:unnamed protein product [Mytilus coruscus]|uniref:Uncharacterized protein n=1 Tax=Mytilus coruscus TaxID=42192 RepID=A0A6J8BX94_MYTCO|nr:unnamed protein product [Mytilus coruscus]
MGKQQQTHLPSLSSDVELSNSFADFFVNKVVTIKDGLRDQNQVKGDNIAFLQADLEFTGTPLLSFNHTTNDEIRTIIQKDHIFDKSTAGFQLNPKLHVTTWIPYNRSSTLFISKYLNSTTSVSDRHKYVYMPQRTVVGSTTIHGFTACKGYKRYVASPTVLDFHHYRTCTQSFVKYQSALKRGTQKNDTEYYGKKVGNNIENICVDFRQYTQGEINAIGKQIEKNVLKVREQLGITYQ